jgi:heme/copper-type cytochrome/quinol oxidase subunit 3
VLGRRFLRLQVIPFPSSMRVGVYAAKSFRIIFDACTFVSVAIHMKVVVVVVIIIIIIITRLELGHDRPVSASSNSLFKGLPSRLCPFGL